MTSSNFVYLNLTSEASLDYDLRKNFDWIFPVSCDLLFLASGIWILTSLVHYGIKNKRWKHPVSRSHCDKLNSGRIYSSVVVCAVLCNFSFAGQLLFNNIGFGPNHDTLCEYVGDINNAIFAQCLFSVQVFLWLRQRAFYTNRMLNVNYSKSVKVISFFSIIVIFIIDVVITVLYTYPNNRKSSLNGCILHSNIPMEYTVTILVGILLGQATFFGLFAYALQQSSHHKFRQSKHLPAFSARMITYCCCTPPSVEEPQKNINKDASATDTYQRIIPDLSVSVPYCQHPQ